MARVADAIARTLAAYGTEYFFCLTGGDHALWIALDDVGIEVIVCRSEHAAVYAADGYARASGRPGFVYGQYGPGVANVVAGLADPYWAMSPVISLTTATRSSSVGRYEYQELEQLPLHTAVTKWSKAVSRPDQAAPFLRTAIRVATSTPAGPVHLEVPADLLSAPYEIDDADIYAEPAFGACPACARLRRPAPPPPSPTPWPPPSAPSCWRATGSCCRRRGASSPIWPRAPTCPSSRRWAARAPSPRPTRAPSASSAATPARSPTTCSARPISSSWSAAAWAAW